MNDWNQPLEPATVDCVRIFGVEVHAGDRVRLRPQKRADIVDIALSGKVAVIEAIESDYDNRIHLAVVVEDDPGREFGMSRYPGHRFFFSPEEVEPLVIGGEGEPQREA